MGDPQSTLNDIVQAKASKWVGFLDSELLFMQNCTELLR